jgi:uncharacterized membrane protein YphA (DoxX/SURF4 family)
MCPLVWSFVPTPRRRPGEFDEGPGWFGPTAAYRLATFRVALAVTTIIFHVPKFNGLIEGYVSSTFHVPGALPWIPTLTRTGGAVLIVLQYVASAGLLVGLAPRVCAWFLAAVGAYVIALDPEHYAHNAQFHLTLLALIGCSSDRVPFLRLLRGDDSGGRCPVWPEHLVRIQLSIVFLYAAVDKMFSPYWGLSGTLLASLGVADHGLGLAGLQRVSQTFIHAFAAPLSMMTIVIEIFLAVAFLFRPLWPAGVVVGFVFVVYLEFLVRPGVFTWDTLAALVMFVPANDRSWTIVYDPECASSRWKQTMLARLDWLRRLKWLSTPPCSRGGDTNAREDVRIGLRLLSPRGRVYHGFEAFRGLLVLLPGPVLVIMALARFGGGFWASRGYGPWDDLPFIMLGGLLVLWIPVVARFVGLTSLVRTLR